MHAQKTFLENRRFAICYSKGNLFIWFIIVPSVISVTLCLSDISMAVDICSFNDASVASHTVSVRKAVKFR